MECCDGVSKELRGLLQKSAGTGRHVKRECDKGKKIGAEVNKR